MSGTDIRLTTRNGGFAGLQWPNPGGPRVLCLHGWLDNAASFSPLAPCLPRYDLVALDFAGHGHSDHRPAGARYYMMDNLWDVDAVLDALGWERCILLGHSLGGVVATSYAAAAPERVEKLITLDGLGAMSARPSDTAMRLKKSMQSIRSATGELKDYPDIDSAAAARQRILGLPMDAARLICGRSLVEHGGMYRWCSDPSLNWHSPSLMTEEQVLDILGAIEAPTLSVFCSQSRDWISPDFVERRLATVAGCKQEFIEGHHYFHMEQPELTARFIIRFLAGEEQESE